MIELDGNYVQWLMDAAPLTKGAGAAVLVAPDSPGKGRRPIEGVASVPERDMQDEIIEPSGLDLDTYFGRQGVINWDHLKGPENVIGRPLRWKATAAQLYLWGYLFPDGVKKADAAWDILRVGERLSWSVEGRVIQRSPKNPKHVLKALVINVALTPNPVCHADTYAVATSDEDGLAKGLTLAGAAPLMPQSLEGDPRRAILERHVDAALGERPCGCLSGMGEAARFVNGYQGAMSHFFKCCGAEIDHAIALAGKHADLARETGRFMGRS